MKKIILFLLTIAVSFSLFSQQLLSSSGDFYESNLLQIGWSIGETVIDTYSANDVILTNGFHQSKLSITNVDDILNLDLKLYPNPTADILNVSFNSGFLELEYSVFNSSGDKLKNGTIIQPNQQINFQRYSSGTYLVKFFYSDGKTDTYKIIKSN